MSVEQKVPAGWAEQWHLSVLKGYFGRNRNCAIGNAYAHATQSRRRCAMSGALAIEEQTPKWCRQKKLVVRAVL